ncbi:hypothetical protein NQ317_001226 [Molorchus minor]|uniref:Hsp90 chaperone protein kinase-targeting subunit n=1 Tax=Molorchus minor TaxID=1323400 RepID=A0ABQ9JE61_9CUCU|nr:hypothetical protein NQ317_001226 [Molorchus minor]
MVDYSKWKNIEISDDEDETHPNIDTPSLFRWRHRARVERMEERQRDIEKKVAQAEKSNAENLQELKKKLQELEEEAAKLKIEEDELQKKDKLAPWNVDTISQPGFQKTVINKKPARPKDENLTEEEKEARMKKFIKRKREGLETLWHLVCEDTANYLVIWCINLEMEEKHDLMTHVAHQTICMQYILELAKQLDYDPRSCVDAFFSKIQVAEVEYKKSFEDELNQFKERIRKRAAEKLEEAVKVYKIILNLDKYMHHIFLGNGRGGEAKAIGSRWFRSRRSIESLPDSLKNCFESQDIQLLQETIAKMDEEEAKYHMKRCVDSGLWVPDAGKKKQEESSDAESSTDKAGL